MKLTLIEVLVIIAWIALHLIILIGLIAGK